MRKAFHVPALAIVAIASIFAGCAGGGAGSSVVPDNSGHSLVALAQSRALPAQSPTPTPTAAPQGGGGLLGGLLGGVVGLLGGVLGCVAGSLTSAGCHSSQNTSVAATSHYQNGLGARDLWSAYGLAAPSYGSVANGRRIAIVTAYSAPNAASDLAAYRKAFGMPACTPSNGCLTVIDQSAGGAPVPAWAMETDIDLAMASVACPTCRLLLVEAASSEITALAAAEDAAAATGPAAISNSFGVPESADSSALASHWDHPGIAITASTGDAKSATFPATLGSVTAVGGTVLAKDRATARGWSEMPWSNSGAGCSSLEAKPAWQTDAYGCASRAVADVSAVASANPGIAVYDHAAGGWIVVNGTSVATPLVAGLYAAAGDYPSSATGAPGIYAKAGALHRVSGSFSQGTPNGLTAF